MPEEKKMTVQMRKERDTKRTIRYDEFSEAPFIGVLYVQKLALKEIFGGFPDKLEITIEAK